MTFGNRISRDNSSTRQCVSRTTIVQTKKKKRKQVEIAVPGQRSTLIPVVTGQNDSRQGKT